MKKTRYNWCERLKIVLTTYSEGKMSYKLSLFRIPDMLHPMIIALQTTKFFFPKLYEDPVFLAIYVDHFNGYKHMKNHNNLIPSRLSLYLPATNIVIIVIVVLV